MKIAIFYNLPFSGAKRTVFEHVKGLRQLGHTVDIYTTDQESDIFSPGNVANKEYKYNYKRVKINLPLFNKLAGDLSDFYILKALHKKIAKDIDTKKYDIALIHTDKFTQAPFILRFIKTKNIYFCLEPLKIVYEYGLRMADNFSIFNKIYESWNRYTRKVIDRENARAAHKSLAISNFGRELIIQAFDLYPKVSYLGVDIKLFKKNNISKKNQILFIGQKIAMNGYGYALEAMKLIPKNIRPELKVLSISKDGNKLSDADIVNLYNESLVTLSLSNFDTFGLVALESLACEVPVIAFNVAGYRETLIDEKTGFLVDFDPKEIAEKIIFFIKNPDKVNEMGHWGRKWVENNWIWDKQIKRLERLLT